MDPVEALADPWLADALDAAATDAASIHHDLCDGAGPERGACSCQVPALITELWYRLDLPGHTGA